MLEDRERIEELKTQAFDKLTETLQTLAKMQCYASEKDSIELNKIYKRIERIRLEIDTEIMEEY